MTAEVNYEEYLRLCEVALKLGDLNQLTEHIYEALIEYDRALRDAPSGQSVSITRQIVAGDWASKYIRGALSGESVTIDKHRSRTP